MYFVIMKEFVTERVPTVNGRRGSSNSYERCLADTRMTSIVI